MSAERGAHTPCRRFAIYLRVQGRRFGFESETRRSPRYFEFRLLTPGRTRLLTHLASENGDSGTSS